MDNYYASSIISIFYLLMYGIINDVVTSSSIGWDESKSFSDPSWTFSSGSSKGMAHKRSHRHRHSSCDEPSDLSNQFMQWFRESHSDPSILTFMADISEPTLKLDSLRMEEPEICNSLEETADSSIMQRALCPWEWKVNRDEHREPKLLSEARCLCRKARGPIHANCVPILREFPVLKRIFCDHSKGSFHYIRTYETVTVGCHSVIARSHTALPLHTYLEKHHSLSDKYN